MRLVRSAAFSILLPMLAGLPPLAGAAPARGENVPGSPRLAPIFRKEQHKAISRRVGSYVARHSFSGSIVVANGTRVVYAHAFGLRNREEGLPNQTSTPFQIGSISKWITTIAILKLVDQGKLSLEAPITNYLKGYPIGIGHEISLADLLSNMSGLQDRLSTSFINEPAVASSRLTAAEAVALYAQGPLIAKPGSKFDYAHTNWVLVQAIAEQVAGMPLEQLLSQSIFSPLHLTATGVTHGSFERVRSGAIAYESARTNAARELHVIPSFLIPTGTIYSNCPDLIKLAHSVYHGRMLSPASLQRLQEIRYQPEEYALGGRVRTREIRGMRKTLAFEVGSFGGFKALLVHVVDDDVTIVVLNNTNMSEDDLTRLSDDLLTQYYRD